MVKFAVAAVVREGLFNLPDDPGKVTIDGKRRQIMARAFPYIDVRVMGVDELLDQLREDTKAAMARMARLSQNNEATE